MSTRRRARGYQRASGAALLASFASVAACRDFYVVPDVAVGSEGGATADATPREDAAPPPPLDAGTSCATAPSNTIFCDDFDVGALGARWDAADVTYASLDTTAFVSAPRSYHLVLPSEPKERGGYFKKAVTVPSTANFQVELDMRVDRADKVYPFGVDGYALVVNLDGYLNEVVGPTPYGGYPITGTFPSGVWRHVTLRIRRGAGTVALLIDGASAVAERSVAKPALLSTGDCGVLVGIYYAPANAVWDGRFDNVRVTTF